MPLTNIGVSCFCVIATLAAAQSEAKFACDKSLCSAHPKCAGLDGECCPTVHGVQLDCCDQGIRCEPPRAKIRIPQSLTTYDPIEAANYARLCNLAYCGSMTSVLDWSCTSCSQSGVRLIPGKIRVVDGGFDKSARVIVGRLRDEKGCVMIFRGSDNAINWISDFEFWSVTPQSSGVCDGCKVHDGFYSVWKALQANVSAALTQVGCAPKGTHNVLRITGHSLGAALTHLAMFSLHDEGYNIKSSYSFEAPRVGNPAFAEAFSERFSRKFPVFRVTNRKDPVVHLPPHALDYQHVQTEVHYNETGGHRVCTDLAGYGEDLHCADQYGLDLNHLHDHCHLAVTPDIEMCHPKGCDNPSALYA